MLLDKINLFSKSIELKMADICDRFDLTMTDIYILMFLENSDDKNAASKKIIETGSNKEEVNRSINNLVKRGYIKAWYPNDEIDNINLKLGDSSRYVVSLISESREDYLRVILEGFDQSERDLLSDYMKRIVTNIYNNMKKK